jgi:RNA polymerase sigma-70 factor, ECF subfamily
VTSVASAALASAAELAEADHPWRAAEALYREHYEFVWRNARRLGAAEDWVDDAVHEVFLVAARRLTDFEGRSSARTWLFGITYRVVLRARRDRARQQQHLERYVAEQAPAASHGADPNEQAQYLRHLLQQLPDPQRAVVILAELEGFTTAEIAESLAVPRGTVDSRLRNARLALTRCIERDRARDERGPQ